MAEAALEGRNANLSETLQNMKGVTCSVIFLAEEGQIQHIST